jgi:hypothetical protein
MKKLWVIRAVFFCMVAISLGFAGTAFAQFVALTENFEGGVPPAGWSVVNNLPGNPWTTNVAVSIGNFTGGSGLAASTYSDHFFNVPYDTELRTPVLVLSGTVVVILEFRANYQDISAPGYDTFTVDISTDGGSSWTRALTWDEDHGSFFNTPGEDVSLDISNIASGSSSVMIRFHNDNLSATAWDWYAQIDDVRVNAYNGTCIGHICYAYCNTACPQSHCDVYLCGAPFTINVGQITYHSGTCMAPPPTSSCTVFVPVTP